MYKKRFLTDGELNIIRIEDNMLKGNINRMCVSDDIFELVTMYDFARKRLDHIFDICFGKFSIDEKIS